MNFVAKCIADGIIHIIEAFVDADNQLIMSYARISTQDSAGRLFLSIERTEVVFNTIVFGLAVLRCFQMDAVVQGFISGFIFSVFG